MRSIRLPSWIERLAGTAPIAAPPHVFLLEAERLVYGRVVRDGGAHGRLLEHASVALPSETFQSGLIGGPLREDGALDEPLAELLDRLSAPVEDASLVLPDSWLRIAFTEVGELPRERARREELLRWKLKRLVPFRVEDLRVRGVEVQPLAGQQEPRRLMLGFGLEALLSQLEAVFARAGVRLGRITSLSLATLAAVDKALGSGLAALAVVRDDGYTLTFARGGEPVLHRHKATAGEMPFAARERLVVRDLKMTLAFLADHLPDAALTGTILSAPADLESAWEGWLETSFDAPVERLGTTRLPGLEVSAEVGSEVAPLLGAGLQEVA